MATTSEVVSPVTSLMKDQVESFGSEVSKGIKYNEGPSTCMCELILALALRGRSSHLTPVKCLKGLPNEREADSMDGEGCFKDLLWAMGEWQKVSTSSLPI